LARRGTKRVFVARSVARPSIPTVSPRKMGLLSAIGVTTRFVLFSHQGCLIIPLTLMNVVAWPGWERICPLGKSRWLKRRGHFAASMERIESVVWRDVCCADCMKVCSISRDIITTRYDYEPDLVSHPLSCLLSCIAH
jgi:hypothetical protein